MIGSVWIVQIGCRGIRDGDQGQAGPAGDYPEGYEREGGALAALYGAVLGMRRFDPGYIKLRDDSGATPDFGFEGDAGAGDVRPRWPDPEHPQQVHLDIEVGDLEIAEQLVLRHGGTTLADFGDHRVYADHAGHPLCLYLDESLASRPSGPLPGRLARVVFDCFSPRSLATFYEGLLGMTQRVLDTPHRIVIRHEGDDVRAPMLAFQHAQFPAARWPDPAYPEQVHLDLLFDDKNAASELAERLGAIRLRQEGGGCFTFADPASHPFDICATGD